LALEDHAARLCPTAESGDHARHAQGTLLVRYVLSFQCCLVLLAVAVVIHDDERHNELL
jgi:hypothetical protein